MLSKYALVVQVLVKIPDQHRVVATPCRIEVRTAILNNEKFVRYRLLFPTAIRNGKSVHEIPFGAIERPDGIEFPAQNWIDYSDGEKGVALLNRGLPGNNVADGTILLSLMRCTSIEISCGLHGLTMYSSAPSFIAVMAVSTVA